MDSASKDKILGLPCRPTIGDVSGAMLPTASFGGLLAGTWVRISAGAAGGDSAAAQKLPLEKAVRYYFAQKGLEVLFFSRVPRLVSVDFRYAPGSFWTVESVLPDALNLMPEDRDDWLYGNLVQKQLPVALRKIKAFRRKLI